MRDTEAAVRTSGGVSDAPDSAPLRVLFAVPQGAQSPGPRYRVFQFLPALRALGLHTDVLVMQGARSTRWSVNSAGRSPVLRGLHRVTLGLQTHVFLARLCGKVPRYDRVFIYRLPVPAWSGALLARHRDRLIFDFDDALDTAEPDGGLLQSARANFLRKGLQNAVRACSVSVTSNARNAEVVRRLGGHPEILPTCVDLTASRFRDRGSPAGAVAVLGWIGTPSTARYLRAIEDVLLEVRNRRPCAVRLVGAGKNPFLRLEADCRAWTLPTQAAEIAGFDIGLMPMPDTAWTRGKAALKALEYGASGAPTVASWTPTNAEILGEQQGALLCRSREEWVAALLRLLDDGQLRSDLGRRARFRVESQFSLAAVLPRLHRVILAPSSAREQAGDE